MDRVDDNKSGGDLFGCGNNPPHGVDQEFPSKPAALGRLGQGQSGQEYGWHFAWISPRQFGRKFFSHNFVAHQ